MEDSDSPTPQRGAGAARDILAILDDASLADSDKLKSIRNLVAPPQAAPLEPIHFV